METEDLILIAKTYEQDSTTTDKEFLDLLVIMLDHWDANMEWSVWTHSLLSDDEKTECRELYARHVADNDFIPTEKQKTSLRVYISKVMLGMKEVKDRKYVLGV